jgi:uncharacterized membrane protein YvbJ
MFCTQCGANNADSATVCLQCGRTLQPAPSLSAQPPGIIQTPNVYVPNYLVFAILSTVLCCLPAGIPAIVYAAQVNGKLQVGDIAGAQVASKNAKMWCWISFGLGLAFCFIYGIIVAAGIMRHMNR